MKGFVFREFINMVDSMFGEVESDALIASCDLPSGGAYTSVGTYDYQEMVTLVSGLAKRTEMPVPDLLQQFGNFLFDRLLAAYPDFFTDDQPLFGFLRDVEDRIHVEVAKLYPDAELPKFEYRSDAPNRFEIVYRSCRPLGDLCLGLLEGSVRHFGDDVMILKEPMPQDDDNATRFTLTKAA